MSYDIWKSTDTSMEHSAQVQEELEGYLECEECGNTEGFKILDVEEWKEAGYDCKSITATCNECEADIKYTQEPDFDSIRENSQAKAEGWY